MTELSKDLGAATEAATKPPAGWEPYTEHSEQIGRAIVRLPRPGTTHRDLLVGAGFDPDEWRIAGSVNTRKWMRYDQEWLYYYKFDVVAGESPEQAELHVEELAKHIRSRKRRLAATEYAGKDAWAFFASDWQIGKREGGNGTPQTVDRVLQSFELARQQVKDLRRTGRAMPTGALVGLGDLVEGCTGFYPAQEFMVDASRREQNRITRELLTHGIDMLAPLFDEFVVATTGGNHGENRKDGKAFTTPGDNDDIAVFEAIREAFTRAGDELIWDIPGDELSSLLDLGGVGVGITHGHPFRKGTTAGQKAIEWWRGQDFGGQAVRDAQVLVTAHFHHYCCTVAGGRTHHQAPAMDPGSAWYTLGTGDWSPSGALTMRFDAEHPLGWDDLRILSPRRG